MTSHKNAEFQDLKLSQIYEDFNQFSEDEYFWISVIEKLGISDITDFGCWTWLLTHKLMELWYKMRWIEPARAMLLQAMNKKGGNKVTYIEWDYRVLENFSTDLVLMTSHVVQFIWETEWILFLQKAYWVLEQWWYILFDSKNPLPEPWKNYTKEKYNKTKETQFWPVNIQVETTETLWNTSEHTIYYTFESTWEQLISRNSLIYRTKDELERSLVNVGFNIVNIYGWWDLRTYNDTCEEMIFLAKK